MSRYTVGSRIGMGVVLWASAGGGALGQGACEVAKLLGKPGDQHGNGMALSGDTLVAGSSFDGAKGTKAGSATVYVRAGGVWVEQETLYATIPGSAMGSDAAIDDQFGLRVAVDQDTILVGAPFKDDGGNNATGFVYAFQRDEAGTPGVHADDSWICVQRLAASLGTQLLLDADFFGFDLLLRGDLAVVGAPSTSKAYVFNRSGGAWPATESQVLSPTGGTTAGFGSGLALSGATLFIGQQRWANGLGPDAGRVQVFELLMGTWQYAGDIRPLPGDEQAYAHFGGDLDADGDTLVAGAVSSEFASNKKGAVFVFRNTGAGWCAAQQEEKLQPTLMPELSAFGVALDLEGDRLITAAYLAGGAGGPTGADGPGEAYLYERTGSTWTAVPVQTLTPAGGSQHYGIRVALEGDTAAIGARQDSEGGSVAGAVFVYDLHAGSATSYGQGCPGSGGLVPVLSISGCPSPDPGNALHLAIADGAPGAFPILLLGLGPAAIPVPGTLGCTLLVQPILARLPFPPLSVAGGLDLDLVPPATAPIGATVTLQFFLLDVGLTTFFPYAATNAVELTFG